MLVFIHVNVKYTYKISFLSIPFDHMFYVDHTRIPTFDPLSKEFGKNHQSNLDLV